MAKSLDGSPLPGGIEKMPAKGRAGKLFSREPAIARRPQK